MPCAVCVVAERDEHAQRYPRLSCSASASAGRGWAGPDWADSVSEQCAELWAAYLQSDCAVRSATGGHLPMRS